MEQQKDTSLLLVTFWPDTAFHDVFLVHAYQWAKVKSLPPCKLIDVSLDGEEGGAHIQIKTFLQECFVCDSQETIQTFQKRTGGVRHTGRFDAWKRLASLLGLRIFPDTFYRVEPLPSDTELASILEQLAD